MEEHRRLTSGRGRPSPGRFFLLTTCVLALGLLAPTSGPHVRWLSGTVEVGSGDPPMWSPAHVGDALEPGAAIRTSRGARAEIALGTRTVRLYENSLLRLPLDLGRVGSVEAVEMEEGSSLFDVLRGGADDRFEVRTPEAVVIVKGTRFSVALEDAAAAVAVYRGTVGLLGISGDQEMLVREGFVATGGTGYPFELSVLPDLDPWEAWDRDEPLPPAVRPRELRSRADAAISEARASARRSLDAEALAQAVERNPEIARRIESGRDVPAAPSMDSDAELSELQVESVDMEKFENDVVEAFTEAMLNGGVAGGGSGLAIDYETSGGPNRVILTGSTFSQTLFKDDVETMLGTGDFSKLDPAIQSALSVAGISTLDFVEALDKLF